MYLRMCLAHSAGLSPHVDSVASMQEQAPSIAAHVRQLLRDLPGDKGPVAVYISVIRQLLSALASEYSCAASQFIIY